MRFVLTHEEEVRWKATEDETEAIEWLMTLGFGFDDYELRPWEDTRDFNLLFGEMIVGILEVKGSPHNQGDYEYYVLNFGKFNRLRDIHKIKVSSTSSS
jgi:hypothetical protein